MSTQPIDPETRWLIEVWGTHEEKMSLLYGQTGEDRAEIAEWVDECRRYAETPPSPEWDGRHTVNLRLVTPLPAPAAAFAWDEPSSPMDEVLSDFLAPLAAQRAA